MSIQAYLSPPISAYCPMQPMAPTCCSEDAPRYKTFENILTQDLSKTRKIYIVHPNNSKESISPKTLEYLKSIGLNSSNSDKVFLMLSKAASLSKLRNRNLNKNFTLDEQVDDIRYYINAYPKDQEKHWFWYTLGSLNDPDLDYITDETSPNTIRCLKPNNKNAPPIALLLEDNESDPNAYFPRKSPLNLNFVSGLLEHGYNVCYQTIRSFSGMCETIQRYAQEKLQLISIRAHGISFKRSENTASVSKAAQFGKTIKFASDRLSPCFENLKKNITLVFQNCYAGFGRENKPNIANHIANEFPPQSGVKIFAPTEAVTAAIIHQYNPIDVKYYSFDLLEGKSNESVTYHIDTSKPESHCFKDRVSFLNLCSKHPLFRQIRISDSTFILQFYSKRSDAWEPISAELQQILISRKYSNKDLEKFSNSFDSLQEAVHFVSRQEITT